MHNDFVVVGPADDPAQVKGADSAAEAFAGIAKAQAPFASRADESGTNAKELSLWEAAGIEPEGSWYIETGQGMGETLTIAEPEAGLHARPTAAPSSPPRTSTWTCWSRAARIFSTRTT